MPDAPLLTIAIPTFNRQAQLEQTLHALRLQVSPEWILRIQDNGSSPPVADVHGALVDSFGAGRAEIVRNAANIGGTANVMVCFERCATEWLVVLGDDDEIAPDYLVAILAAIRQHPSAVFINFSSSIHQRSFDFTCQGLAEFIERLDNWSNVLFISVGIYNHRLVTPYLRHGFNHTYTLAPHIAVLLAALRQDSGITAFLSRKVVTYKEAETMTWPHAHLSNTTLLLALIPELRLQQIFIEKTRPYFVPLHFIAETLAGEATRSGHDHTFEFRLRALLAQGSSASPLRRVAALFLEFLVSRPRLGCAFFRIARSLLGKARADIPANQTAEAL